MPNWILELEPGVYLADGEGDPPRTLVKASARQFSSHPRACAARNKARKIRQFALAKVTLANLTPSTDAQRPSDNLVRPVGRGDAT